jgi:hypothetical protein
MKYLPLLGFSLSALLSGCFVEADNGGPPTQVVVSDHGALVVDWTIQGRNTRDQCDLSDVATIDVTVTALNGAPAGEFQQSCAAFATTIDLAPGSYTASAVLLDSSGRDRTTAVQVRAFDILGSDQLSVPIDFSASAFYAP